MDMNGDTRLLDQQWSTGLEGDQMSLMRSEAIRQGAGVFRGKGLNAHTW